MWGPKIEFGNQKWKSEKGKNGMRIWNKSQKISMVRKRIRQGRKREMWGEVRHGTQVGRWGVIIADIWTAFYGKQCHTPEQKKSESKKKRKMIFFYNYLISIIMCFIYLVLVFRWVIKVEVKHEPNTYGTRWQGPRFGVQRRRFEGGRGMECEPLDLWDRDSGVVSSVRYYLKGKEFKATRLCAEELCNCDTWWTTWWFGVTWGRVLHVEGCGPLRRNCKVFGQMVFH